MTTLERFAGSITEGATFKKRSVDLIRKHGSHNQKTHGGKGGGGDSTRELLVTQAGQYETFDEFSSAISLQGLRPKVWHIADEGFELNPDYKPTNRLGGTSSDSGLFVGDPETWQDYAVGRSTVIEYDVTDLSLTTKPLADTSADFFPDQSGNQGFFVRPSAFSRLKEVKRMPIAEALSRAKKQQDSMPRSKAEARQIWEESRTVKKHGSHNQKTHGRGGGGSSGGAGLEYPTSKSNPELKATLKDYVVEYPDDMGHAYINSTLRDPFRNTTGTLGAQGRINAILNEKVSDLDKIVELSPALTEPLTTYRGIGNSFAMELNEKGVGATYVDNGFTSVSLDMNTAGGFPSRPTGNIMQIVLPTGTKAINPSKFFTSGKIGGRFGTDLRREKELILGRGTNFEVLSIEDSPYGVGNLFKVGIKQ